MKGEGYGYIFTTTTLYNKNKKKRVRKDRDMIKVENKIDDNKGINVNLDLGNIILGCGSMYLIFAKDDLKSALVLLSVYTILTAFSFKRE